MNEDQEPRNQPKLQARRASMPFEAGKNADQNSHGHDGWHFLENSHQTIDGWPVYLTCGPEPRGLRYPAEQPRIRTSGGRRLLANRSTNDARSRRDPSRALRWASHWTNATLGRHPILHLCLDTQKQK